MDPQHRHFLEVAWHALEHAGYVPETAPGPIGIFGGMYNATYYQRHLAPRPEVTGRLGELALMLGNEKDYVTTRVAHKLGLTGPAVSDPHRLLDVARGDGDGDGQPAQRQLRHRARRRRRDHLPAQQRLSLPGGRDGVARRPHAPLRRGGRRAPCSPTASRWSCCGGCRDAIAAGDPIYAVLLGAAVNNDGSERASFTAPSPDGQAAVIAAAHDAAGIDAADAVLRRGARHRDAARRSHRRSKG